MILEVTVGLIGYHIGEVEDDTPTTVTACQHNRWTILLVVELVSVVEALRVSLRFKRARETREKLEGWEN